MELSHGMLNTIDWNFAEAPVSNGVHNIHPYPAKFIPQIPRKLIELFPPPANTAVFDPFCGSGTTLVEATSMGYDAWGIDLHPLACLIAKVKLTPLPLSFFEYVMEVSIRAQDRMTKPLKIPDIPRLDHWFKPDIQRALAAVVSEITMVDDNRVRDALQVALSSIIVQVSNQESDTRYAAIDKPVTSRHVFERFQRAAIDIGQQVIHRFKKPPVTPGKASVLTADILSVSPSDIASQIGLVVTSPPYPNAYEYWLYHKYRMYWLGMDPIAVREKEIGARPHYFKKNHQDESDFERQMSQCFELLSQIMISGGYACFVVGRSIIHGRQIDNAAILKRAASQHEFDTVGMVERQILKTRKSFNLSHANINREHIVVFEKRA